MPFLTEDFVVRSCGPEAWRLTLGLDYQGRYEQICVPAGFLTDLATVPRVFTWLIPRYGTYSRAAILHDYLCVEAHAGRFRRSDADGLFRRVLREEQVSLPRRWLMWAAVRAGSGMQGASGGDWLRLLFIAAIALPVLALPVTVVQLWVWLFRAVEWLGRARH